MVPRKDSAPLIRPQYQIGVLGEEFVADWLISQAWILLARRWRSTIGEIDLVAHNPGQKVISFVEVKTRSPKNWDENGLLSLTQTKQQKIWHTAELFLQKNPVFLNYDCRMDLALVRVQNYENLSTSSQMLAGPNAYGNYFFWLVSFESWVL